jgi:hypothetical protein
MNSFVKTTNLYNKIILSEVIILRLTLGVFNYSKNINNHISDSRDSDGFWVIIIEIIFKSFFLHIILSKK